MAWYIVYGIESIAYIYICMVYYIQYIVFGMWYFRILQTHGFWNETWLGPWIQPEPRPR